MNVKLIKHTFNPEFLVSGAARLCYSDANIDDLLNKIANEEQNNFIEKLLNSGHESPLEHVTFTFGIEGISRVTSHQLVRHRIGVSFSQKSQRYVNESQFDYIIPESIKKNKNLESYYEAIMKEVNSAYKLLIKQGIPPEDARYLLPNATETKMIVTFNARSLYHFFKLRCCNRAQWEIRELANIMLKEVKKVAPVLFSRAGKPCLLTGKCPEGKMSCKNK